MFDSYKITAYKKRLDKESKDTDTQLKFIYMWVKQGVLTLSEFKELIIYINQN